MRCLTLAEHLRERGAGVRFVCRAHRGNLIELLRERHHAVAILPAPPRATDAASDGDYAAWLGVSQEKDTEETLAALQGAKPDWLVVDHYALDAAWERSMRPHASRILVIDDLANRSHDCDVLLNQNFSNRGPERYGGRVPDRCRLLLGPRHALLRPEFARCRQSRQNRDGRVRRIFIFLGGTDPGGVTGLALDALSDPEFAALEADVVVGANNAHRQFLETKASNRPRTRLYGPTTKLADLMARADLAIGAGGGTTWERLCLGLPSVVVSIAENQVPACEALAEGRLIRYLGADSDVSVAAIREELRTLIGSPEPLAQLAIRGQMAVDGRGAARVAECLDPTPPDRLSLRPANEDDARIYFYWVNDPEVRRQSLRPEPIDWPRHQEWFAGKLATEQSRLFVLEAGDLPVGQIRFDREGAETRIDYSIDSLFRGHGWATRLLALGVQEMSYGPTMIFRADVKESNPASSAVFRKLGFAESGSPAGAGIRVFRLEAASRRQEA